MRVAQLEPGNGVPCTASDTALVHAASRARRAGKAFKGQQLLQLLYSPCMRSLPHDTAAKPCLGHCHVND